MFDIFKDPTIVAYILILPLLIIGIAKFWKRIKDKKAAAAKEQTKA